MKADMMLTQFMQSCILLKVVKQHFVKCIVCDGIMCAICIHNSRKAIMIAHDLAIDMIYHTVKHGVLIHAQGAVFLSIFACLHTDAFIVANAVACRKEYNQKKQQECEKGLVHRFFKG